MLLVFAVIVVTSWSTGLCLGRPAPEEAPAMSMNPTAILPADALGHPAFCAARALRVFIGACAGLSLIWTPFDPTRLDIAGPAEAAVAGPIPFGTDHFGRDILR
jgi:ABC-type dipeptide/oligopeptide/nickel transport system permease subunit